MAAVYPYFAIGMILLLVLTEPVVLRVDTKPSLSFHFSLIFFGIEIFPKENTNEKSENGPSSLSVLYAFLRTLSRLVGHVELAVNLPSASPKDPMKKALAEGGLIALLAPVSALFPPLSEQPKTTDDALLYVKAPLWRTLYLVFFFVAHIRKQEGRKQKWQKRK